MTGERPRGYSDELAVVGLGFREPSAVALFASRLTPGAFADHHLGLLWRTLCEQVLAGRPVGIAHIGEALHVAGRLVEFGEAGGPAVARLHELHTLALAAAPSGLQSPHCVLKVEAILDNAARRDLGLVAGQILREVQQPSMGGREAIGWSAAQIVALLRKTHTGDMQTLYGAVQDAFAMIDARIADPVAARGVPHGLPGLDTLLPGLLGGNLIVLGARPSIGKTSVCLSICAHAARATQQPILFASLEQKNSELAERFLAAHSDIPLQAIREGTLDSDAIAALQHARTVAQQTATLWLDDRSGQTLQRIEAQARRLQAQEGGLALIAVDYLGRIRPEDARIPQHQQLGRITNGLKDLASDLNVPVVLLSQLNRASEDNPNSRPEMRNLFGSGAIEADADVVILLHRPVTPGEMPGSRVTLELILAKHRNGPTGSVEVLFDRSRMRFEALVSSPFGH